MGVCSSGTLPTFDSSHTRFITLYGTSDICDFALIDLKSEDLDTFSQICRPYLTKKKEIKVDQFLTNYGGLNPMLLTYIFDIPSNSNKISVSFRRVCHSLYSSFFNISEFICFCFYIIVCIELLEILNFEC